MGLYRDYTGSCIGLYRHYIGSYTGLIGAV